MSSPSPMLSAQEAGSPKVVTIWEMEEDADAQVRAHHQEGEDPR